MTHEQIHELMLVYAVGSADADEIAAAEQLLGAGDVVAQAAYAEALAVVASVPLSLEPVSPPKSVRDMLLLRVVGDASQDKANLHPANAIPRRTSRPVMLAWASGALAACLALAFVITLQQNRRMQSQLAATTSVDQGIRTVVRSPYVQLAKLNYENQPDGPGRPGARVVYCPSSKQFNLIAYGLAPLPPGRVYEMWLITEDDRKIPAGTFNVDDRGNATHYARAPREASYVKAAVTDEPASGSKEPSGAIHLFGSLR